jgi:hypothetical protein
MLGPNELPQGDACSQYPKSELCKQQNNSSSTASPTAAAAAGSNENSPTGLSRTVEEKLTKFLIFG